MGSGQIVLCATTTLEMLLLHSSWIPGPSEPEESFYAETGKRRMVESSHVLSKTWLKASTWCTAAPGKLSCNFYNAPACTKEHYTRLLAVYQSRAPAISNIYGTLWFWYYLYENDQLIVDQIGSRGTVNYQHEKYSFGLQLVQVLEPETCNLCSLCGPSTKNTNSDFCLNIR